MRLEMHSGTVRVTLSERNLKRLLAKLAGSPPNLACTLTYDTRDGVVLIVTAESDAIHYAHPERDTHHPGPMHPDTEKRVR